MGHSEAVSNAFYMSLNTVKEAARIREQQLAALGEDSEKRQSSLQLVSNSVFTVKSSEKKGLTAENPQARRSRAWQLELDNKPAINIINTSRSHANDVA